MSCIYCKGSAIKRGKSKNGAQRYKCKRCGKSWQSCYVKNRIPQEKYEWVQRLTCEGCGISSTARLLYISKSSVQRVIVRLAQRVPPLPAAERNQSYEIDELRTHLKRLSRKSICFTKSVFMLKSCVALYSCATLSM